MTQQEKKSPWPGVFVGLIAAIGVAVATHRPFDQPNSSPKPFQDKQSKQIVERFENNRRRFEELKRRESQLKAREFRHSNDPDVRFLRP